MLSKRLKELRAENGISQAALADKLGFTQQTVAKWETDKTEPNNETLMKLASMFAVSIDYLLGKNDNQRKDMVCYALNKKEEGLCTLRLKELRKKGV